jgi:hypothetical protein
MTKPESIDEDLAHEDAGFDLAFVGPETTGLPFFLLIQSNIARQLTHGPRVFVFQRSLRKDPISISVPAIAAGSPRVVAGEVTISETDLKNIFEFVRSNRELLCRYWVDPVYATVEMLGDLKPI